MYNIVIEVFPQLHCPIYWKNDRENNQFRVSISVFNLLSYEMPYTYEHFGTDSLITEKC